MIIRPVETEKDLKKFIDLPYTLYYTDSNFVGKMDADMNRILGGSNPFYEHARKKLFLAYDGKNVVGRIAAIIDDNFIHYHEEKTGFFGFFDCVNDSNAAHELFGACEAALKKMGMDKMIGPVNPSSNDECGLLVDGFDSPPKLMMPYNPAYYIRMIEGQPGYRKEKDLLALQMDIQTGDRSRLQDFVKKVKKRHPELSCRRIDMRTFKKEVKIVKHIYDNAWRNNWGFVPWTESEVNDIVKQLIPLVDADVVRIGYWADRPVGFLMALPDYNQIIPKVGRRLFPFGWLKFMVEKKNITDLRLLAMGVMKEYQNKGVGALMYNDAYLAALEKGYQNCEFSWILEDNVDTLRIGRLMGAHVYKRYRIYSKNFI